MNALTPSRFALPLLLAVLSLSACRDKETMNADIKATFQLSYDGAQLERYKDYPYKDFTVRWTEVSFCISDLTLIKADGQEYKLADSEFLDFTPDTGIGNLAQPIVLQYQDKAPAGAYTGLKIGFGVKPSLNAKRPADIKPEDPLYNADYWSGWKSYIFLSLVGAANTDRSGGTDLDLVYHCGGDKTYQVFTFDHPITVSETGGELTLNIDLKRFFYQNNAWLDVQALPTFSHGIGDVDLMADMMGRFGKAVEVK